MNQYKGLQFHPDSYVLAGTIFEMGVPVEAPLQLAAMGMKGAAKLPSGIRQAHKISKEVGSAATPLQAAKTESGLTGAGDVLSSVVENSRVSQHVAEDASDIVLAVERVEDMGGTLKGRLPDDEAADLITRDLSPRGQITARELMRKPNPAEEAEKAINTMAGNAKETPLLSSAAQDSLKTRGELTGAKGTPIRS